MHLLVRRRGLRDGFSNSKDERLLAFYENVRQQVEKDNMSGGHYRFGCGGVKQNADGKKWIGGDCGSRPSNGRPDNRAFTSRQ
jgi:hypothetical protein